MKPHPVPVLQSPVVEPDTAFRGQYFPKEINELLVGQIFAPRIARLRTLLTGIGFEKYPILGGFADCYSKTDA